MSYRLAIIETHPIQYKVPWFRRLAACPQIDLCVFYAMIPNAIQQGVGFGVAFEWDEPLLEGYPYQVLRNVATEPSVTSFGGCDTPELYQIISRTTVPRWDAVMVNGWVVKTCLQALLASRLAGVPCIVRGESNAMRRRVVWKKWIHRLLLAQYARALYIGKSNHEFYRLSGVPESRLSFGPYGVDNVKFADAAAKFRPCQSLLRVKWGIHEYAFCVLFSGKLIEKKRPMDLLEALRMVVNAEKIKGQRPIQLLMAGDGDLRAKCEAYVRAHNLPVTFAGFLNQKEMPKAYAAANCLVLPSDDGETWGLVVNEAMASGLPVIVSDRVGCHPDLVESGVTGFVFPFGKIEALAERIMEMMQRDDGGAALGRTAQERVGAYSVDRLVQGTLEALNSLRTPADKDGSRC